MKRVDVRDIVRCPKFRLAVMDDAVMFARNNIAAGLVDSARHFAAEAAHEARSIMARRELFAHVIVATQAREGITTTMEQARAAYNKVQAEEAS